MVGFLGGQLAGRGESANVSGRVPVPMPARCIRVSAVPGYRRNLVTDQARLLIECWAGSDADTAGLARIVRAVAASIAGTDTTGVWVSAVPSCSTPVLHPDENNLARYQFTIEILLSGAVI